MFYLRDGNGNELNWFDDFNSLFQGCERKGFMASDLVEEDKEYKLTIDVPGVDKKDINVRINNNTLIVEAKQNSENENKDKHYIRRERYQSSYSRSFYLADADETNVHAKLENGILNIAVGKKNQQIENKNVISIE